MNAGPRGSNPKWHGGTSHIPAQMHTDGIGESHSSGTIRTSIEGEMRDLPGQHAFSQLTQEYGSERHEAYDSPLAQPAYSEHGKVMVGKSSQGQF